ncbi:hypothetical protein [Tortoise microvirus 103]|nr:hypothetical protein [Tortoise microvirus 5]QCS37446.1 hypothetical protein [Tortoise microvirus 103]
MDINDISVPYNHRRSAVSIRMPVYSDIVDDSDFKRVQDEARIARLTHDLGGVANGSYDADPDSVTSEMLFLRSPSLDPADVDTLKRKLKEDALRENQSASDLEMKKALDNLNAKADKALDKVVSDSSGTD